MTRREDNLIEVRKSYTLLINERPVVIHDVPMLYDPESQEAFLAPETAERIYELVHDPNARIGAVTADVYAWQASGEKSA